MTRKIFVPPSYTRDLHNKLQRLYTKDLGVHLEKPMLVPVVGREKRERMRRLERRKSLRRGVIPLKAKRKQPLPVHLRFLGLVTLSKGHIASQCPNRRVMIVKDDGEIKSESSLGEVSPSSESRALMMVLTVKKTCLWGSCVNVASERLVRKLALSTFVYQRLYKFQWLSERRELLVDKQIKVTFTLEGYEDNVVCHVVSIEATHLLLGMPWQFDKRVIHDGVTNRVVLKPLSPRKVHEDKKMKVK
ncbi:hypothetical protein CR513_05862, partial [Mucuna pruriens]